VNDDPELEQLRELYALHRQGLFTLALSITRRRERAEDAVHEAFVKLCAPLCGKRGPPTEDGEATRPTDPVAYAYRMVRHAAIDQVRRYWPGGNRMTVASDFERHGVGRNGNDVDDAAGLPLATSLFDLPPAGIHRGGDNAGGFDPAVRSMESEVAGQIARSLERLPDEQREAVVLRIYAGLTFEQIAAVIHAPLSTVAARYRRALEKLRPCLEKLL